MTKTELINTLDHLNTVIENYRADYATISRLLRGFLNWSMARLTSENYHLSVRQLAEA